MGVRRTGLPRTGSLGRGFDELLRAPDAGTWPQATPWPARGATAGPPVLAIASGKGGTGKSILASNLAVLASQSGARTLLLDADQGLANAHLLLDLNPERHMGDLLEGDCSPEEVLVTGPAGVQLLPGGSGVRRLASMTLVDVSRIGRLLSPLAGRWSEIIVDLPAGLSRASLAFQTAARDVLVVTTPDLTAMADAYGLIKTLSELRRRTEWHLVVNRCRSATEAFQVYRRLSEMAQRFLACQISFAGFLLEDEKIRDSVSRRRPVVLDKPRCGSSQAIGGIRQYLIEVSENGARGVQEFFLGLKRASH